MFFLQHLNAPQPTVRSTMATENDNTILSLDTLVIKDSKGRLTKSVYRKPTLTDQYPFYNLYLLVRSNKSSPNHWLSVMKRNTIPLSL